MDVTAEQHEAAFCSRYHRAIELIGRRWTGVILRELLAGARRFNELHDAVPGLSDRLLAERLRELEAEAIVVRHVLPGPPVRVEYSLSERGRELSPVICGVAEWAERWLPADAAEREPAQAAG